MSTKIITIDLGQPLPDQIKGAEAYNAVWAIIFRYGIPIGQVVIDNQHGPVTAVQLRSEIIRQLAQQVLNGRDYREINSFEWAIGQREKIPTKFIEEPELTVLLPSLTPQFGKIYFLSVVVCTRDRPDELRTCLTSLSQLDHGRHQLELIVVDNNPDSGLTESVVADFPKVRYELERRPGVAYGRNKGLLAAQGDIVAYIDDDVVVPPQWISHILAPFADPRVMCVSGLVLPLELESQSQEMFEKYGALGRGYIPRIFDKSFFFRSKKHVVHTWDLGGTANVAIRKSVLPESGMFDETLGPGLPTGVGEDIYMFYRILKCGHLCYYDPAAYVWHKHRGSMKALRKQLYNYNKGQISYQLRTLVTDGDRRAVRQILLDLPRWHLRRIWEIIRGRQDYSLRLAAVEIWGNLMGFYAFWHANQMHRRLNGPNANPIGSVRDGTEASLPPDILALSKVKEKIAPETDVKSIVSPLPSHLTSRMPVKNGEMSVSVVVPAFNAGQTIGETLQSLQAQTFEMWEAIVVDDGSTDDTAVIVSQISAQDERIRLIQQSNQGGSAARNTGIQYANNDWMLFLDADDWLLPTHLEKMTAVLAKDDTLDAVHCGWARVDSSGEQGRVDFAPDLPDLFPTFSRECAFLIHTCLIRRLQVEAVGGFDSSLRTCQDWDFWQRIARNNTKFGSIPEKLALYRSRPGSISLNGVQQLADSLHVISQAYQPDPRVPNPFPRYANGLMSNDLATARIQFACWSFGLILGAGEDARPYLQLLEKDRDPDLDPAFVAACFLEAALLPQGLPANGWDQLWPQIDNNVTQFLTEFEQLTGAVRLSQKTLAHLEEGVIDRSQQERPFAIGQTFAVAIEISQPLSKLPLGDGIERVNVEAWLEGERLGTFLLSAHDEVLPKIIAEHIAQVFAWQIMGRYFSHNLFPSLKVERRGDRMSVWRDSLWLATLPVAGKSEDEHLYQKIHDETGWTLFLQEIWQRPSWPKSYFYDPALIEPPAPINSRANDHLKLQLGEVVPDVFTGSECLEVNWYIGEHRAATVTVEAVAGVVRAHALRVALIEAKGYDLCTAVIQHVLLGRPLDQVGSLSNELSLLGNGRPRIICDLTEREYVKFIILAQERTGSIYLQRLLDSHPQIHCVGEIFNQNYAIRQTIKKLERPIEDNEVPLDYVADVVFKNYDEDFHAVGFRLFYDHAQNKEWRDVWQELRLAGVRVIHLERRNLLDRYLSLELARRSNIWREGKNVEKPVGKAYDAPISLDPLACFSTINQSQVKARERMAIFGGELFVNIYYEDLSEEPETESRRILEFLGVDWQPLMTGTKKQRARSKPDIIVNYEELKQYVLDHLDDEWVQPEWLTYFDDE